MAYDNGSTDALLEDFEPESGWEPEWAEAFPRYRKGAGRIGVPTPRPPQPVSAVRGGTVQTPGGGRAQVTLPAAVATKEAVDAIVKELKTDIAKNADAIRKLDQTVDTNTSTLDRKITALQGDFKKSQQQSQFSAILPLLMSRPPELKSITLKGESATEVEKTEYKAGDNMGMLIAMLAMSGGLGGGGSGSDSTPMLLALAFMK